MDDSLHTHSLGAAGVQFLTKAGANGPFVRPNQLEAWRQGLSLDRDSDIAFEISTVLKNASGLHNITNQALYEELITLHARAIGRNADAVFKLNGQTIDTLAATLAENGIKGAFVGAKFFVLEDFLNPGDEQALLSQGLERIDTYNYHFEPRPAPGSHISHVFNTLPLAVYYEGAGLTAVFEKPIPLSNIKAAEKLGLTYKPL